MKINANAKINLTLDILGVREDGFHALRSVMVPVTLCDELVIEKSESLVFDCNIKELCTTDNLCVRAAKLFFATLGTDNSASIYLKKNIPFPAGLGGGSADAAAVLKGLNELYGNQLDRKLLFSLAERLGSDVPLCLLGSAALCEGRGEELTPLSNLPTLDLVIAIGKSRLSTPEVYRRYDAAKLPVRNDSERFISALASGSCELASLLGNAFEPVTDILAPETKLLREEMLTSGALNARLSGSGPSVYGVFKNESEAQLAAEKLKNMGYFAISCRTIA